MLSYCSKCKRNTESINSRVSMTSNGKTIFLSKCIVCNSKKLKFYKKQELIRSLSQFGIRSFLSKIPLLGDSLFKKFTLTNMVIITAMCNSFYMMNINILDEFTWYGLILTQQEIAKEEIMQY